MPCANTFLNQIPRNLVFFLLVPYDIWQQFSATWISLISKTLSNDQWAWFFSSDKSKTHSNRNFRRHTSHGTCSFLCIGDITFLLLCKDGIDHQAPSTSSKISTKQFSPIVIWELNNKISVDMDLTYNTFQIISHSEDFYQPSMFGNFLYVRKS